MTSQPFASVRSSGPAPALAIALVAFIFGLDLLWSVIASSTAPTEFGAVDEPAHLATALLLLLALLTLVRSRRPSMSFLAAALIASVAIDLDHIPELLGWQGLTGDLPRPYTHSLMTPLVLIVVGALAGGRIRPVAFGAAFGVGAHLCRDLCTGPGVAILWPLSSAPVRLPYLVFAAGLILIAVVVSLAAGRGRSASRRIEARREAPLLSWIVPGLLAATVSAALLLTPARAVAAPIAFGAYVPKGDRNPSLVQSFAHRVGHAPVIVSSYKRWRLAPFVRPELRAVWSRGAVPLITWEPWTDAGRGFPLREIAHGRYDGYVRRAAESAAAWGRPILLRFAHEMNGTWFPWGRERDGNTARLYKASWRHLVGIFHAAGADNVKWVWTPNVDGGGQYPFARFYPGNKWVDWVGLDGFNWARRGEWQSFTDIFGSSYETLSRITSRPMIVAETGSSQSGGDKAAWVSSALDEEIPQFSRIRAVVWFSDQVGDVDFRIDSSSSALQAFRSGISSPRYGLTRSALLSTPSSPDRRAAAPPAPSGGFGQPSLFYRLTQKLHGRYLWIVIGLLAGFLLLLTVLVAWLRRTRRSVQAPPPRRPGKRQAGGSEP